MYPNPALAGLKRYERALVFEALSLLWRKKGRSEIQYSDLRLKVKLFIL